MRTPLLVGMGLACLSLVVPSIAESAPATTVIVANALSTTVASVTSQLQTLAIRWLSAFMLAQFLITNLGLLKSGADIEAVWGKFAGSLLWFGFCFYLVENGAGFIQKVGGQMFLEAGTISGAPGIFTAGRMFDWGIKLSAELREAVNNAGQNGILDFLPSLLTFVSCLIILIVSAFIGFKVFIIKIELMITVMMTPLSFSFMALNALKDQGMAPFKSLISLIYRVMILAVIVSAMDKTGQSIIAVFATVTPAAKDIWSPVFAALMIFSLLGYLAYKSDSMAANLASGSTSLGTGDVAQAAAAGAAAGAAIATAGAAGVAGASKSYQAMGDFMKGLGGGGGSIRNASAQGSGSAAGTAPARPAALSAGSGGFPTNKSGAPIKESSAGNGQATGVGTRKGDANDTLASSQQATNQVSGKGAQQAVAGGASASEAKEASSFAGKHENQIRSDPAASQEGAQIGMTGGNTGRDGSGTSERSTGNAADKKKSKPPVSQGPLPVNAAPVASPGPGRKAPVRPTALAAATTGAPSATTALGDKPARGLPGGQPSSGLASENAPGKVEQPVEKSVGSVTAGPLATSETSDGSASPAGGAPQGSAANAGIAGSASPLEQKVDKLLEHAAQPPKAPRPTLSDRLGTLNEHVARESAATHVSINANAD